MLICNLILCQNSRRSFFCVILYINTLSFTFYVVCTFWNSKNLNSLLQSIKKRDVNNTQYRKAFINLFSCLLIFFKTYSSCDFKALSFLNGCEKKYRWLVLRPKCTNYDYYVYTIFQRLVCYIHTFYTPYKINILWFF